jgi:prepilin-type N-terminal cleavage/methylation domain-containing protein
MKRAGVTLIEMLIVVAIIGAVISIAYPAMTTGLAAIRLRSAAGSAASFLTSEMNSVERREQPEAIVIAPHENTLAAFTAQSGEKAADKLEMPQGISIEGDEARRFVLYPGGAFPRIRLVLKSETGGRRSIEIDPITAVPHIQ